MVPRAKKKVFSHELHNVPSEIKPRAPENEYGDGLQAGGHGARSRCVSRGAASNRYASVPPPLPGATNDDIIQAMVSWRERQTSRRTKRGRHVQMSRIKPTDYRGLLRAGILFFWNGSSDTHLRDCSAACCWSAHARRIRSGHGKDRACLGVPLDHRHRLSTYTQDGRVCELTGCHARGLCDGWGGTILLAANESSQHALDLRDIETV